MNKFCLWFFPIAIGFIASSCSTTRLSSYNYIPQTRPLPNDVKSGPVGTAFSCQSGGSFRSGYSSFNYVSGAIVPNELLDYAIVNAKQKLRKGQRSLNGLINATTFVSEDVNSARSCVWVSGHLAISSDSVDYFDQAIGETEPKTCEFTHGIELNTGSNSTKLVVRGFTKNFKLKKGQLKKGDVVIAFDDLPVDFENSVEFDSTDPVVVHYLPQGKSPEMTALIVPYKDQSCSK